MIRYPLRTTLAAVALAWMVAQAGAASGYVLTYHGSPDCSGHYVVPGLNWERARALRLDENFHAKISGHVYVVLCEELEHPANIYPWYGLSRKFGIRVSASG